MVRKRERYLAGEKVSGEVLFPDSNSFIAAARSEDEGNTGMTGSRVPIQTPNPIGMTFQFLNFFQFQSLHIFHLHSLNRIFFSLQAMESCFKQIHKDPPNLQNCDYPLSGENLDTYH